MEPITMTNADLIEQIELIWENMQVCGRHSSYTTRTRPLVKALLIEAERRGLDVS